MLAFRVCCARWLRRWFAGRAQRRRRRDLQAGRSAADGATVVFVALDGGGAGLQAGRSAAGGATSDRKSEVHHVSMLC